MASKNRICITADQVLLDQVLIVIDELNEQMGGKKMTISSLTNVLYEEFLEKLKNYYKEGIE